jgi:hypothetical protein
MREGVLVVFCAGQGVVSVPENAIFGVIFSARDGEGVGEE